MKHEQGDLPFAGALVLEQLLLFATVELVNSF
jgi:hypothetical protein